MCRGLAASAAALLALCAAESKADPVPDRRRLEIAEARRHFESGLARYNEGNFPAAVEAFLAAYRIAPGPELAYNAARAYERMGENAEAIRYYRLYLADPTATSSRAEVERKIAAIAALEAASTRRRDALLALPPSQSEMTAEARRFFERGAALFRRRDYASALQAFTAAYNFARLPEILYNMAMTLERLSQAPRTAPRRAEELRGQAADHYAEYLRRNRTSPERAAIEAKIRALRARATEP